MEFRPGATLLATSLYSRIAEYRDPLLSEVTAIETARGAPLVSIIIITIGASIFIQGVAQIVFDKQLHRFPAISGDDPIKLLGATILPQSLSLLQLPFFHLRPI